MSSSIPANMDLAALVTIGVSRVYVAYIIKMMLISRVQSISPTTAGLLIDLNV
jgi:hypothetical protein